MSATRKLYQHANGKGYRISVYRNGEYCYSTIRFLTLRDAIADVRSREYTIVASVPMRLEAFVESDKVTASFDDPPIMRHARAHMARVQEQMMR